MSCALPPGWDGLMTNSTLTAASVFCVWTIDDADRIVANMDDCLEEVVVKYG